MIGDLALGVEGVSTIDELRQLEASAAALYFGAWSGRAECAPTLRPKTGTASRLIGHATKDAAPCSPHRCRTGRPSGR